MGRKLHRSVTDREIFGVCGGFSEYFNIDSTFFRIIFVMLALLFTLGIWIYLIFALVLKHNYDYTSPEYHSDEKLVKIKNGRRIFGVCAGLAEYFDVDLVVLRVIMLLGALIGFGIIFYIVAALLMPKEDGTEKKKEKNDGSDSADIYHQMSFLPTDNAQNGKSDK